MVWLFENFRLYLHKRLIFIEKMFFKIKHINYEKKINKRN